MLRIIKSFNSSSQFIAEHNGMSLSVYAPSGRMWATVAKDSTFRDEVCAFRRHSLPMPYDHDFTDDQATKEFPEFMGLFVQ